MTASISKIRIGFAVAAVIASIGIVAGAQARIPVEPGGQGSHTKVQKSTSPKSAYFSGGHPLNGHTHVRRPLDTDPD
jgi:hypothetical protein